MRLPRRDHEMSQKETPASSDLRAVVAALSSNERFCVVTHESPDGDALGSMLGAGLGVRARGLGALGKDVLMFHAGELPFPAEYGFLPLEQVSREAPADFETRVLLAVDCAN